MPGTLLPGVPHRHPTEVPAAVGRCAPGSFGFITAQMPHSPRDGHRRLLLGAHGDAALQVVELTEVFAQRAAALEVPGDIDSALEGRKEEEEAAPGTGPHSG